jgi:hypothetical protein
MNHIWFGQQQTAESRADLTVISSVQWLHLTNSVITVFIFQANVEVLSHLPEGEASTVG